MDEIKFGGHGCAISQASLSMMTMKLKGKSRAAAREMLGAFHDLVAGENDDASPLLGDLRLLCGVRKFPHRVECAMLVQRMLERSAPTKLGQSDRFHRKRFRYASGRLASISARTLAD